MGIKKYKKQIIFGISLTLFIGALAALILFFVFSNKTIKTSSANDFFNNNQNINNIEKVIPNVTKENTTFKISDTKKKVESVNISATNRLSDYNLYYLLVFENTNKSEIKNENYLIFNDLLLILDENCTIYFKYELDGNFSNKAYKVNISNIQVPEAETEKATEKELKEQKVDKKDKTQSTSPYFIKVNYGANVVTVYTKDADENYTVPYKAMVCSCGTYTPTSGTYKTTNKYTWRLLIHNVYGQYATRIVGSILFHSVPYTSNKKDTLEYWEFDKLGQTASAGCVRLTVRDAKWIYDNCPRGTMVEFYSSSNPGPLGKPSAQKISSNTECRNWDPTDPASNNPWRTYNANKEEEKTDTTENTITNNVVTDSNDTPTNNTPIINNTTIIDKPIVDEPPTDEPTTDSPSVNEPYTDEPITDKPAVDEPSTDEPIPDKPTVDEPSNDESTIDNSLINGIV